MKTTLLLTFLILLNLLAIGQNKKGDIIIIDSKIKPWITEKRDDYQSIYHFSESEGESILVLIIDKDSCYAQIRSGEWRKTDGKDDWILNFETIKNVKIRGNKFFSDKTNGEFVTFSIDSNQFKGLMIYRPWSSWIFYANSKGYEIGWNDNSFALYFNGKFAYSSWRQLSKEELERMTISDLKIMRNEIYARYAYLFKPQGEMDLYFRKQSWYRGQKKNVDNCLTELEKRNIELIQTIESIKSGL